jgi:sugar lactone lactonase YvrE
MAALATLVRLALLPLLVFAALGSPALQPVPIAAGAAVVRVLAAVPGGPDDLAAGPRGSLYISLIGAGAVVQRTAGGRLRTIAAGLSAPEGIAVEPDGTLVVAEQGRNRLLHVDPLHSFVRPLVSLPNATSRAGVDGIGLDGRDGTLLIPDSPNGRLLRVSLDGRRVSVLAAGLGRPVGVAVARDGAAVVVDETLNGAYRVVPGRAPVRFGGRLSIPDDIVPDGAGGFYVTCLGDSSLRHLSATGATTLVAAGLPNPQGLVRLPNGTLVVAEEDANQLVAMTPGAG